MELTLVHLYPNLLNLYGDRGNILTLARRCQWRGIDFHVTALGLDDPFDGAADILFIGGDQDREQQVVSRDLREVKGPAVIDSIQSGMPALAVCGGYQLFQHSYRGANGVEMLGLGVFDAWTVHPGSESERCVGNLAVEWDGKTLIGFENHGGRTFLNPGASALGRVLAGDGNNGKDGFEGARFQNAFGTYMHGSLLPKNPFLADHLLQCALTRKYGEATLPPLDDHIEMRAHDSVLKRTLRGRARS